MKRERFHLFTGLMWLALPIIALRHWQLWDRLPASMAVHFNAANQPMAGCRVPSRCALTWGCSRCF